MLIAFNPLDEKYGVTKCLLELWFYALSQLINGKWRQAGGMCTEEFLGTLFNNDLVLDASFLDVCNPRTVLYRY